MYPITPTQREVLSMTDKTDKPVKKEHRDALPVFTPGGYALFKQMRKHYKGPRYLSRFIEDVLRCCGLEERNRPINRTMAIKLKDTYR